MKKSLFLAALLIGASPVDAQQVYGLLNNSSATGTPITNVAGSGYNFALAGTFGGATVSLQALDPTGNYSSLTGATLSAASSVCINIPQGSTVRAAITGGSGTSLTATIASIGGPCTSASVTSTGGISTGASGTIAAANTFQVVFSANLARRACFIYNNSSNIENIEYGLSPVIVVPIAVGGSFSCNSPGWVEQSQIRISSASVGATFAASVN